LRTVTIVFKKTIVTGFFYQINTDAKY
jgi:hypothetical protein